MYGAGNIGRGFIGKTFSDSEFEVCFIDVNNNIVKKLNEDREYPVKIVFNDMQREEIVKNVRAVNGLEIEKIAEEITSADIMATAVGVNVIPKIVKPICYALKKRFKLNTRPLNIIICENLIDADQYLRRLIENEMGAEYKPILDKKLGLIEASIGRMVPVMTEDMQEGNILKVWVEPYEELPVDKEAFIGKIPDLKGLVPYSPFSFYIKRKLYIHNMGHALCAYLGWAKGYTYIYECIADKKIRAVAYEAMKETAKALTVEYKIPMKTLTDHIDDLLNRFANKVLADTVARVGRDPLRKIEYNDRLIGAAVYCEKQGIEPHNIIHGIVAALRYNNKQDESSIKMQAMIKEMGICDFLFSHCGLKKETALYQEITALLQL